MKLLSCEKEIAGKMCLCMRVREGDGYVCYSVHVVHMRDSKCCEYFEVYRRVFVRL